MLDLKKDQFLTTIYDNIKELENEFGSYATGVGADDIRQYLKQFKYEDMQIALKLLYSVDFFTAARNMRLVKSLLDTIRVQNNDTLDNVLFCPMSTDTGDSASSMTRLLKMTLGGSAVERRTYKNQFLKSMYDLRNIRHNSDCKKIVFVDHFIGTGDSILRAWGIAQRWQNDHHEYYVGAIVSYESAMDRIENETDSILQVISGLSLPPQTRVFHQSNNTFSYIEQNILKRYCRNIEKNRRRQYGHNNSQSLVIFHDRAPNNALPILHKDHEKWKALFPRFNYEYAGDY